MEYRQEPQKETNVRYILEDGIFKKMYVVRETEYGVYLRKKRILDITDTPKLYPKHAVYTDNVL